MKICYIEDDYILFLRQFDQLVYYNKNHSRPYVGVVFQINDMKYYAPLSSPKPKHLNMKNSIDFKKIGGGKYGAINLNCMVPVEKNAVTPIDFNAIQDEKYRRLLQNQYKAIKQDWERIKKDAHTLYQKSMLSEDELTVYEKKVMSRCCDFHLLEEKCKEYEGKSVEV